MTLRRDVAARRRSLSLSTRPAHTRACSACQPGGMSNVYTHGHHESVLRSHRWRTAENSAAYLLPHLRPGMRVLDVGCGPGTITLDLARAVAPGAVVGIEPPTEIVAAAAADAAAQGLDNVRFTVGDVFALDLGALDPGGHPFDVVHAHQVLQHL